MDLSFKGARQHSNSGSSFSRLTCGMSIRVGVGAGLAPIETPQDYWRWIQLCEASGIDSVWHSDQLLGPSLEPLALMAALAARTERIRFGMNALVVAFRDPVVIAKQIASIDYLSAGRLLPTFGVGNANDAYWGTTGRLAAERGQRANEAIALIRALLEDEEVAFDGLHYQYDGPGIWPRPSKPIPLWIGGDSPAAIRRTAAMGDGWLGGIGSAEKTAKVIAQIKAELASTGRQIESDHYGATVMFRIGAPHHPAVLRMQDRTASRLGKGGRTDFIASGTAEAVVSQFRRHIAGGVAKFVAIPVVHDSDDLLDQTRLLASEIIPAIEGDQ